ncbi:YggT family protein [Corynebacterium sp. H128]|uniref:YggT family protein n=1 Tax=unclassified Corynebacterium TaxID=2624378 RepID=UPI0030B681B4
MNSITAILAMILQIYLYLLIIRIIIEMIQSFSRQFRPPRWFALIAEPVFIVTDPPVKALRRLIPPIRTGGVALDVSILVLFIGLQLLIAVLHMI